MGGVFSERGALSSPTLSYVSFPVGRLRSSQACDKMLRSRFFVSPDGESSRIPAQAGGGQEKQSAAAFQSEELKSPDCFEFPP